MYTDERMKPFRARCLLRTSMGVGAGVGLALGYDLGFVTWIDHPHGQ